MQDLPGDLTGERAQSVACAPLISDMCALLARLCDLSHLDDREQEVSEAREPARSAGIAAARLGVRGAWNSWLHDAYLLASSHHAA